MKKLFYVFLAITMVACAPKKDEKACTSEKGSNIDSADKTNNFYDNVESYEIAPKTITIEGEVGLKGEVDLSKLSKHTVIVKETSLTEDHNKFIGAYRYDGYSLFDILNSYIPEKLNKKEFAPIIDLYVEVSNDKGEKVVISWGEIYYPNHLNEIIIATDVRRIVPSKTKELWELPKESKLIVSSDLITERNISNPSKIKVCSYPKSYKTVKDMKPNFSEKMDVFVNDSLVETLKSNPKGLTEMNYETTFYGRGRGIHSTTPFKGVQLKEVLKKYMKISKTGLQQGMVVVVGADGYRCVFTLSELMNRNDQSEVLLICDPKVTDEGIFRVFPACDFFSDRAVKAIKSVEIVLPN